MRHKIGRKATVLRLSMTLAAAAAVVLQGCANPAASPLSPEEAFARSASALSGSDRFGITGEVSVVDPSGWVANKVAYEGEVTGHGVLSMQLKNQSGKVALHNTNQNALQPLTLLNYFKANSAEVSYAEEITASASEVHFKIKLKEDAAKQRIADSLRAEMAALGSGSSAEAKETLRRANEALEKALGTLQVTTECRWTAERRTWFPKQLKEETLLKYEWKGKPYAEKRVAVTNFLPPARNGTMKEQ